MVYGIIILIAVGMITISAILGIHYGYEWGYKDGYKFNEKWYNFKIESIKNNYNLELLYYKGLLKNDKEKQKMALVKKCDMCGKVYENYGGANSIGLYHATSTNSNYRGLGNYDLCPDCMNDIRSRIKENKEEEEKE